MIIDINKELQLQDLYQDEYLVVQIDQNQSFIYVEWLQHAKSEDFRRLFLKLADLTEEYKIEYWLSDAQATHYLEFADQNWVMQLLTERLDKSTLKKIARVSSKEGLALMDTSRIHSYLKELTIAKNSTEFEVFVSQEAALDWLFPKTA